MEDNRTVDITKLQSIIEAIDSEAKMPNPSHANLARLVAMFFRDLIEPTIVAPAATVTTSEPETVALSARGSDIPEEKKTHVALRRVPARKRSSR